MSRMTREQQQAVLRKLAELFENANFYCLYREERGKWHRFTNIDKKSKAEKRELAMIMIQELEDKG